MGYDPNFLPEPVPLPDFRAELAGDVLRRPELREGVFADYVNYTVAMHGPFRTPLFAALNVDQTRHKTTDSNQGWRIDSRIGAENQLDNGYYFDNPWDRGHLARRATAAWGDTLKAAQRADADTYFYSNAALQHRNLNQDEWLALEDWVLNLEVDAGDKFSVISGPVFGDFMRTIRPERRAAAYIPSAFFKIVFFMNKRNELDVRAFLMPQDEQAMRDRRGRRMFDHQIYQVSVAEIEEKTGLDFPEVIPRRNPIYRWDSDRARARNVTEFPERREVDGPPDIIQGEDETRAIRFADEDVSVFIAAALINPDGDERQGEWVSIANLGASEVSIDGWCLIDDRRRKRVLTGKIPAGEAVRIQPLSPVVLANDRNAFIQLIDADARQIDRVPYTKEQAQRAGVPIVFAYRDLDYDRTVRGAAAQP